MRVTIVNVVTNHHSCVVDKHSCVLTNVLPRDLDLGLNLIDCLLYADSNVGYDALKDVGTSLPLLLSHQVRL